MTSSASLPWLPLDLSELPHERRHGLVRLHSEGAQDPEGFNHVEPSLAKLANTGNGITHSIDLNTPSIRHLTQRGHGTVDIGSSNTLRSIIFSSVFRQLHSHRGKL